MGKIVRVIKSVYGKINWGIIKNALTSLLSIKMKVKENNVEIKVDKKFIKEFAHSNYSANINKKLQNVKANLAFHLKEIVENSGHIKKEENAKPKHSIDAHNGFEKYTARFIVIDVQNNLSKEYSCVIVVRCPNYKERYIYDIVDIKKVGPPQRCNM